MTMDRKSQHGSQIRWALITSLVVLFTISVPPSTHSDEAWVLPRGFPRLQPPSAPVDPVPVDRTRRSAPYVPVRAPFSTGKRSGFPSYEPQRRFEEADGGLPLLQHHEQGCCSSARSLPCRDSVKEFKSWACYKQVIETLKDEEKKLLEPFKLDPKKPALLFFDSEGGLLHKQQLCVDPPKFVKVIRSTKKLSDMRLRLRKSHLAERAKARKHMDAGRYGKAIVMLDKMVENRKIMSGFVSRLVDQDLEEIEKTGNEMLIEAARLKEEKKIVDSFKLYKEIEEEFERLEQLSKEASKHRKELLKKLRDMGL